MQSMLYSSVKFRNSHRWARGKDATKAIRRLTGGFPSGLGTSLLPGQLYMPAGQQGPCAQERADHSPTKLPTGEVGQGRGDETPRPRVHDGSAGWRGPAGVSTRAGHWLHTGALWAPVTQRDDDEPSRQVPHTTRKLTAQRSPSGRGKVTEGRTRCPL